MSKRRNGWGVTLNVFDEKMLALYETTDAFLYDSAAWNRKPRKLEMREWIADYLESVLEPGSRVLTYGDLRSVFPDPDGRDPRRTIELHLTGHMERFAWSFNGVKFSGSEPVRLTYGERLRIVLVNDTMMTHPIHLHGLWSDVEDDAGEFLVRKHTVDMPPGSKRHYRVTADALGRWAFHCHLLYHMEAGMMREVRVDE